MTIKNKAMKPEYYFPANGTDGMIFMDRFCDKCYKQSQCAILTRSLIGEQPEQWIYDNDKPTCTSFNPNRPKAKKKLKVDVLPKLF